MLKQLSLFLSVCLLSLIATASEPFKVGIDANLKPFAYITASGEVSGFDVDIAKEVCVDLNRECVFVPMDWDGLIPSLKVGKIDAIISAMSITDEREKVVDFTRPYYKSKSQLLQSNTVELKTEVVGKIGVLRGSTDESYAENEFPGVTVVSYTNQYEVLFDLSTGRIDYALGPRLELLAGSKTPDDYVFVGDQIDDPKYYGPGIGMAIKENQPELLKLMNDSINRMREDGRWQTLSDKYFDVDIWVY